ncbi:MAG: hypothetical protein ABIP19_02310 [Dermatophilaceae bacterium]
MAGTEHAGRYERRRFITRHDVEDAATSGQPIRVNQRDVVTSEAAQRAADLGVRIEREGAAGAASSSSAMTSLSTAPSRTAAPVARSASADDLRRAVRAAVLAELGSEPAGLDAAIERVLKSRAG